MESKELRHLDEAQRLQVAAMVHKRSSEFWRAYGDADRARHEWVLATLAVSRAKRAKNEALFAHHPN
jgi:hypothetical protein